MITHELIGKLFASDVIMVIFCVPFAIAADSTFFGLLSFIGIILFPLFAIALIWS